MKYFLFWTLFLLGMLCFLFLCFESSLRLFFPQPIGPPAFAFDPRLGAIPVPAQSAIRSLPGDGFYTSTNDASGMRVSGLSREDGARPRILFLGDSFTYGTGVSDAETFSARIEASLPKALVWNAGNPGTGTDYALKFLRVRGAELAPEIIVLGFFANDFADNGGDRYFRRENSGLLKEQDLNQTFAFFREKEAISKSPVYVWLTQWSHSLSLLRRWLAWRNLGGGSRGFATLLKNEFNLTPFERGIANDPLKLLTETYLRALSEEAKTLGARLEIFYFPNQIDFRQAVNKGSLGKDEEAFRSLIEKIGLKQNSLTLAFQRSGKGEAELFLHDGHYSRDGHKVLAEEIMKELGFTPTQ